MLFTFRALNDEAFLDIFASADVIYIRYDMIRTKYPYQMIWKIAFGSLHRYMQIQTLLLHAHFHIIRS